MTESRVSCLTLDLEDDWSFDDPRFDHLVLDHIEEFIELIDRVDLPVSIFVVGRTLEKFPQKIDRLRAAIDCEFHLHSYQHDTTRSYEFETEVRRGMEAFEEHFGHAPRGYRAPQGVIDDAEFAILEDLGFVFDSSIFPSYRPGKYNNLDAPTEPYRPDGVDSLIEVPIGTISSLQIPTALSYFKLFGWPLSAYFSVAPLPGVLVYNVHLHDLYRTDSHDQLDLPKRWIMTRNLDNAESMFVANMATLRERGYQPLTMMEVVDRYRNRFADASVGTASPEGIA